MAPSALRQTFLLCVPTVVVLLSFLWFKKKRCAARSDPGGTKCNSNMENGKEIPENASENLSLHTCIDKENNSEKSVLCAVEESIMLINHAGTANSTNEVKSLSNIEMWCPSELLLPEQPQSELKDSEEVSTAVGGSDSGAYNQDYSLIKEAVNSMADNFGHTLEISSKCALEEEIKNEPIIIETLEKSSHIESLVPILVSRGTLECAEEEFHNVKSLQEMSPKSASESNNTDVLDTSGEIVESVGGSSPSENEKECEKVEATIDVHGDKLALNGYQEEFLTEIDYGLSKKGNLSVEDSSSDSSIQVESDVVCATISDVEVMDCVPSKDNSDINVGEISELECACAVSNTSSSLTNTLNETNGQDQPNLSSMKELEEDHTECINGDDSPIRAGAERDSANHSPADVMLASPSMSSYSDVHSERSSDSGKGCSYVATPPSRTPASCSSLSGDLSLHSVYEFVLPQQLVGRLIGRHGSFVHQIKAKTHAHILIKRHPDTPKLKICAVEGTHMDIENALEMVREKFPAKRYPEVTLEQVCFLPPVPTVSLIPEYLQLQLVAGVNNDVILSSLVSPAHFFLQQPTHPTFPALNQLSACMNMAYNEPGAPELPSVEVGIICAAPAMGGWYRAQVVSVAEDSSTCDVKFIDYGGYLTLQTMELRQIRSDFMTLPFQAAECYLAHVVPAGGTSCSWSAEARARVESLTQGQVLQAQVCGYAEDGIPVVYLFSVQGPHVVPIHQELVAQGLADWWESSES